MTYNPNDKKKCVLVVEDEDAFRDFVVSSLELTFEDHITVVQANDGLVATRLLNNQVFDCIITDIQMPKRDGKQFISHVRQSSLNNQTPVIVVTSNPETPISASKVAVLPKPLNAQLLLAALKRLLKLDQGPTHPEAKLLKFLLPAMNKFITERLHTEPNQSQSTSIPDGHQLEGDFFILLRFQVEGKRHRVLISFPTALLEQVREKLALKPSANAAQVCESVRKKLYENLRYLVESLPKDMPIEIQDSELIGKEQKRFQNFALNVFFTVPFQTPIGDININFILN